MSRIKTHVKVNDQVVVISGEHKTASGKVLQVLPKKQQVLIEGVRMIKKHAKKPLDDHLMIEKPERYIEDFANIGLGISGTYSKQKSAKKYLDE